MSADEILKRLMPELPKPHVRIIAMPWLIGQFVMTWAKHERMLADMLARLSGVDYDELRDALLDSQISAYEREIRKAIVALPDDNVARPYLEQVLEAHIPLRQLRNDIVHGFWAGMGPDDEYILKRKHRKEAELSRTVEMQEIEEGYQKLDRLGIVVINASRAFAGEPLI